MPVPIKELQSIILALLPGPLLNVTLSVKAGKDRMAGIVRAIVALLEVERLSCLFYYQ